MKTLFFLLLFISLSFSQTFDKPNEHAPKELSQFQFMVGKWEGTRKVLTREGYKITEVKMISYYTYNGYGFHDEWYDDGKYWGTTLRIIDQKTKKWRNQFFNNKRNQNCGELFEMEYKDGSFFRENKWSNGRFNLDRINIENINKDHFIWRVDISSDNGKTWVYKNTTIMDMKRAL